MAEPLNNKVKFSRAVLRKRLAESRKAEVRRPAKLSKLAVAEHCLLAMLREITSCLRKMIQSWGTDSTKENRTE